MENQIALKSVALRPLRIRRSRKALVIEIGIPRLRWRPSRVWEVVTEVLRLLFVPATLWRLRAPNLPPEPQELPSQRPLNPPRWIL